MDSPSLGIHYFGTFGMAAISYSLAALLLAAGVLAAWAWQMPQGPAQFAGDRAPGTRPGPVAVIGGTVDCRWADASTAAEPGSPVAAGRRFVLASGLLQIWYDSRVEVLVQGPAIYEVELA